MYIRFIYFYILSNYVIISVLNNVRRKVTMLIALLIAIVLVLTILVVFFLYNFGLIAFYHPMNRTDNKIKVACVGDSITYGCMVGNWRRNNYPTVLGDLLGEDYCVNNFGYTNRTAIKTADYPYTDEKLYKQSLDFNPDIVFLMLGSNDSKKNNWDEEKYRSDLGDIIDSYLVLNPAIKVYLLIPPPVFEIGGRVLYQLRKDIIEHEICPAVKEIADKKGIECIDMYNVFQGQKELFADGVHPNARGSEILAQKIYEVINT